VFECSLLFKSFCKPLEQHGALIPNVISTCKAHVIIGVRYILITGELISLKLTIKIGTVSFRGRESYNGEKEFAESDLKQSCKLFRSFSREKFYTPGSARGLLEFESDVGGGASCEQKNLRKVSILVMPDCFTS